MTATRGHRILVADDDPEDREDLVELLRARGDDPRAVATLEELLAALEEEEFCGFVLDQAFPLRAGLKAFLSGGERAVRETRASDKRRTDDGDHVTPIIAVTSYSEGSPFVTSLFEIGITTFVAKPIVANQTYFLEKARGAFARAGRDEHSKCAALARRPSPAAPRAAVARVVGVAIDGALTKKGRTAISIEGVSRQMQDSKLIVLLRAIVAREDAADGWASNDALGLGTSRSTATYVRAAFNELVPPGFDVLESDHRGNHRLHPGVVVTRVEWDALAEHPDASVRKLALDRRRRREG